MPDEVNVSSSKVVEVRQSALGTFEMCGESYRRRYIEHEPSLTGMPALRGKAVHFGAQVNHSQKINSGKDLPKKQIVEAAVAGFEESKARDGFRLTREEISIGVKPILARTLDSTTILTELYANDLAPTLQPAIVEKEIGFNLATANGTIVQFKGRLDLADTGKVVHDLKTSGRKKTQADIDNSLQGAIYHLLYRSLTKEDPAGFQLDVLVDTKTPQLQKLSTRYGETDLQVLVHRVNAMIRAVQAGIFAPAAVGSWICCEKWCSHWATCFYVNSERKSFSESVT